MIFLFESVHRVMQAERALKAAGVAFELMPTPKEHSAECGMCIRASGPHLEAGREIMCGMYEREVDEPAAGEAG